MEPNQTHRTDVSDRVRGTTPLRILFLAPRVPHPKLERENVRPYHHIRFLSLRHDVDLVAFGSGGSDWEARRVLRRFCPRIQILPLANRPVTPATVRHAFTRKPLAVRRYATRDMMERLQALHETRRYDLVFCYSLAMAGYAKAFPGVPKVLDLVEVSSLRWNDYAHRERFPTSAVFRREGARLMTVEQRAAREFHRVLLASETEAEVLRSLVPGCQRIMSLKTPAPPHAPLLRRASGVPTLLIAGHLDHIPNSDAVAHFARNVFPTIRDHHPDAVLRVVGRNPPGAIRALALQPGIFLEEREKNLREMYQTTWISVVPHRVSRGVRNEILESMSFGVPTVASREAFVGLDALPDTDLVVTDGDAHMTRRILDLIDDSAERDRLGFRARRAILNNYSHWSIALRLEEMIEAANQETLVSV